MPKIIAVYFQASGFPSQSLEYAFKCCLGDIVYTGHIPLLVLIVFVCAQMDCYSAVGVDFLQEFEVHVFYPILLKRVKYW